MRVAFQLIVLSLALALAPEVHAEPVPLSDVLASPAKYHGSIIQVSGVFWTDGEGALLIEAPTEKLDLDRAVAVSADWKALTSDENYQRLKVDRSAYIQKKKTEDSKATWIVFQAAVVFEGRFEDALSLAIPAGSDGQRANPYGGCRTKIDLRRVVSYGVKEQKANQSPEPTPPAGTSAAEQPLVPAAIVAHL